MSSCFGLRSRPKVFRRRSEKPQVIEISDTAGGQRVALASFDYATEEDVISQGMIDILGVEVSQLEKEGRSAFPTKINIRGETKLNWSLEKDPTKVYSGIFYVSAEQDPNYDVVLGSESAKKIGPSTGKSRCSSNRSWLR